jgi:hypothetical protein
VLPVVSRNAGLYEEATKQGPADLVAVWVRKRQAMLTPRHILMIAAGIRADEARSA